MRRPRRTMPVRAPKTETQAAPGFRRDRLAVVAALVIVVCLGSAFFLSRDTQFLMPGPLASAHGAIENCSACHTTSGTGKLSWIHGLFDRDPLADSKACLTCHKMSDTAFNAHGASTEMLNQITTYLAKVGDETAAPQWARTQSIAFPTHDMMARGISCVTCHQEHQGVDSNLIKISNEKCSACHVIRFDSFDGNHPQFQNYPFKRRTRIIYDHDSHFGKHFPEVAKKNPARRIPDTCSACHSSHEDKRVMAVLPFEQTCMACHLDQINGKERVSGPKGIAFLTLPGLDVKTLRQKNAPIGEWPDASEAELSPFMKVIIGREERGRALIKIVDSLNLQNLTEANDDQIKAVTNLVWEIKRLFYALISGKASDVLADLNIGGGAKLSGTLVADLTASIPRDVVISAQQKWLPNLATEITKGGDTINQNQSAWSTAITVAGSVPPEQLSGSAARKEVPKLSPDSAVGETASIAKLDPPVCTVRIFGQCLVSKGRGNEAEATKAAKPSETAGETDTADAQTDAGAGKLPTDEKPPTIRPEAAVEETDIANAAAEGGGETLSSAEQPREAPKPPEAFAKTQSANVDANGGEETPSPDEQPVAKAKDQTDDLLSPTEDELRAIEDAEKAARPEGTGGQTASDSDAAKPQTETDSPIASIESDVDAESWAEYGGWYRQDYAIFYRPTGHKDKFIYSWLLLTGPQASTGTGPAAMVFDFLTSKDAPGSCTKCHSVDDLHGKGRAVNFFPASVDSKGGRFTNFIHEPHFQAVGIGQRIGILENRGCLTCHDLEKGRSYLKSYEQGNPQIFVSSFGMMKKDLCQTCHANGTARQDCLLCHKYHVGGVNTPIMSTKIPTH